MDLPRLTGLFLGILLLLPMLALSAGDRSEEDNAQLDTSQKLITTTVMTNTMPPIAGHEDRELGTRIESVESIDNGKAVKIYVSVPRNEQSDIEEVIVLGKQDKQKKRPTLLQTQKFEIVNNLEAGRSGIVIYLGKHEDFALKLNYTEPRPDVEPDVFNRD